MSIEPNANWQGSPNHDNPVDSVAILSNQNDAKVYAILRDKFGNFAGYSLHTNWKSADSLVAGADNGITGIGEGVISRGSGPGTRTTIVATDRDNPGLSGSLAVILVNYYYTRLRIIVRDSTNIDSLRMTTNDDTTLRVMGLRSDTKAWEYTYAQWKVSGTLSMSPSAPDVASAWTFYPSLPGSGTIRVTLGNDAVTSPDTVGAVFVAGPPTALHFEIITPPQDRIAGDTILAVVKIQNRTGLISGSYCFGPDSVHGPAVYQTLQGSGGRPSAIIAVDQTSGALNTFPSRAIATSECFLNGLDTVRVLLYNAPYTSDSVQQLFVSAANLTSATDQFALLPAPLRSLVLQDNSGKDIGDSITMRYPSDSRILVSVGFDRFGNKRGPQSSLWSVSGSLHAISQNVNVSRIYYESASVTRNEQGTLRARAMDTVGGVYADSVYVTIAGPAPKLVFASTRDASGDGYLDEIVLVLSGKIPIPEASALSVSYSSTTFSIDSIRGASRADSDSMITIFLAEQKGGVPQTAWRPVLTAHGFDVFDSATCLDGAGPVVWSVVKSISSIGDRTQDLVTVQFSEPVGLGSGNALTASVSPSSIFNVWVVTGAGDTALASGILSGISSLYRIVDATTIQFYMSNGNDLTDKNMLSLRVDPPAVADASQSVNVPVAANRRVAVKVNTAFPEIMQAAPNPAVPTLREEGPGILHCLNNPSARTWVRVDRAGVLLTFKVMPLANPNEPLKARLSIYDNIGNLVNSDETGDIFPPQWRSEGSSVHDLDIYWNGTNKRGMMVAGGIYRAFLYLESSSDRRRLVGTIGIMR